MLVPLLDFQYLLIPLVIFLTAEKAQSCGWQNVKVYEHGDATDWLKMKPKNVIFRPCRSCTLETRGRSRLSTAGTPGSTPASRTSRTSGPGWDATSNPWQNSGSVSWNSTPQVGASCALPLSSPQYQGGLHSMLPSSHDYLQAQRYEARPGVLSSKLFIHVHDYISS